MGHGATRTRTVRKRCSILLGQAGCGGKTLVNPKYRQCREGKCQPGFIQPLGWLVGLFVYVLNSMTKSGEKIAEISCSFEGCCVLSQKWWGGGNKWGVTCFQMAHKSFWTFWQGNIYSHSEFQWPFFESPRLHSEADQHSSRVVEHSTANACKASHPARAIQPVQRSMCSGTNSRADIALGQCALLASTK